MNTNLRNLIALLSLLGMQACSASGGNSIQVSVLPEECRVATGKQVALTLDGHIPANTKVHWDSDIGQVVWTGQGLTATFLAPDSPGDALISVSFANGTPTPVTSSRVCAVVQEGVPPSPPNTPSSPTPANAQISNTANTIIISEVMGNTCNGIESKKYDQYVELFNYGSQPVDVSGWWLYDEGEAGTPDQLAAWNTRSNKELGTALVTNSTVIPPRGFAVILSPVYAESYLDHKMPYRFPAGTVILTAAAGNSLGDDYFGIIAAEEGRDTITLYIGGTTVMDHVIDTYGTPKLEGLYLKDIDDDRLDHLPLYLHKCESVERIDPLKPDQEGNWSLVEGGSPGEGPY